MSTSKLDPQLREVLTFLSTHESVRHRIPAPVDKTVVYSGGHMTLGCMHSAWRLLAQGKQQDPQRFDYVTLEERLRQFHVVAFGESLLDHANRVSNELNRRDLPHQANILWRALSGIYVQGARGKVRALILPGPTIAKSVFSLTEVKVLLRPDVITQIQLDPTLLRDFQTWVRGGGTPAPIVVM